MLESPYECFKWTGTGLFAIGAMVISVLPSIATQYWPFALFLIGHVMWTIAGLATKDRAVLAVNAMYIPFDLYAVIIRAWS